MNSDQGMTADIPNRSTLVYAPRADMAEDARYAIYFAPRPDSVWWTFGSVWLGRDPVTDAELVQPPVTGFDTESLARITAAPRRYGFHATLKAPFRLAPSHHRRDVYLQAANLAPTLRNVQLPPLRLSVIDGFIALIPASHDARIAAVAAQCVSCFDNLRARPDAAELARRRNEGLTFRQDRMLAEWGYPYVFDEFRFHVTLTGKLKLPQQQQVLEALTPMIAALASEPLVLDALTIFLQPLRDAPFVVTRRYDFDGGVEIYRND